MLVVLLTAGDLLRMRRPRGPSSARCWLSAVRAPGRRPAKTPIRFLNGPCGRSVQLGHRSGPGQTSPGQPAARPSGAVLREIGTSPACPACPARRGNGRSGWSH